MYSKIFTPAEYKEFARSLRSAINSRSLTIKEAAEVLGVTRQSLHLYLKAGENQPRRRVLERACRAWDLRFTVQGQQFDKGAFGEEKTDIARSVPVQLLLLPEAIERLDNAHLDVKLVRRDSARIYLEVEVRFAS